MCVCVCASVTSAKGARRLIVNLFIRHSARFNLPRGLFQLKCEKSAQISPKPPQAGQSRDHVTMECIRTVLAMEAG